MAMQLPQSHTLKGYIYGRIYDDRPGEVLLHFATYEMSKEYFLIKTVETEIPLDWTGVDPTALQIESLREAIKQIRSEAQAEVTQLEGQINNLLALPSPEILSRQEGFTNRVESPPDVSDAVVKPFDPDNIPF